MAGGNLEWLKSTHDRLPAKRFRTLRTRSTVINIVLPLRESSLNRHTMKRQKRLLSFDRQHIPRLDHEGSSRRLGRRRPRCGRTELYHLP